MNKFSMQVDSMEKERKQQLERGSDPGCTGLREGDLASLGPDLMGSCIKSGLE